VTSVLATLWKELFVLLREVHRNNALE